MAFFRLLLSLVHHADLVIGMAAQQARRRYVDTVGGIAWSLLQPLILIATYWVVFDLGFKVQIRGGTVSFTAYYIAGVSAWMFLSEAIGTSVGAVGGSAYLVKKVVFPVEALPVTPVITAAIVHLGLLAVVVAFMFFERGRLPWTVLQLPYYTVSAIVFCLGLAWLTSALQVFFRDVQKLIEVGLGVWFWLTPIVWPREMVPPAWRWVLDLNPAYYVVHGYRNSLIYGVPLWADPVPTLAFWGICLVLLVLGAWVFERLRPDFAEVL
jgi:ABC-type polysaccharide/polyol phosphate export permease